MARLFDYAIQMPDFRRRDTGPSPLPYGGSRVKASSVAHGPRKRKAELGIVGEGVFVALDHGALIVPFVDGRRIDHFGWMYFRHARASPIEIRKSRRRIFERLREMRTDGCEETERGG